MAGYRGRLERDLDRWIADGLVPAASRAPILSQVGEPRRLDAASALAVVGGLLLAVAALAFVAANWAVLPRLVRFALVLGLFLAAAGGAAAFARSNLRRDSLLAMASLIYAAAIGLTGQIFDITGEPRTALHAAGAAALALALAGRSGAAGLIGLIFLALADAPFGGFGPGGLPWLAAAAPLSLLLAWLWRSRLLAHGGSLALGLAALLIVTRIPSDTAWGADRLAAAAVFAGLAFAARAMTGRRPETAPIAAGWFICAALGFFAVAGLGAGALPALPHRALWLVISSAVVALGLRDHRPAISAAGVVSLVAAGLAILFDLGLGLMTAAAVFAGVAVLALAFGLILRRHRPAGETPA